jgi:bifunctional DNA-binding transcriptional regulator/antitoxin component of YhaV-PrlF toxin-antitoxin module
MATIAITIPKNLREKLGEDGTQEFVSILNQINAAQLEEMERLNGRTFEKFQQEIRHNRELISGEIDKKLAEQRADLLKWMFIFWSTTIISIVVGYILK